MWSFGTWRASICFPMTGWFLGMVLAVNVRLLVPVVSHGFHCNRLGLSAVTGSCFLLVTQRMFSTAASHNTASVLKQTTRSIENVSEGGRKITYFSPRPPLSERGSLTTRTAQCLIVPRWSQSVMWTGRRPMQLVTLCQCGERDSVHCTNVPWSSWCTLIQGVYLPSAFQDSVPWHMHSGAQCWRELSNF